MKVYGVKQLTEINMSERNKEIPASYLFTEKLLSLLANLPATEKKDDEVIAEFIAKRVLPKRRKAFLECSKEEQYYIALFDQFSDEQLQSIDKDLSHYIPDEQVAERAHVLGGHKIKKFIFGLSVFAGRKIK